MLALWISALPDYLHAKADITADGTPTGNLLYATICFLGAAVCVTAAATIGSRDPVPAAA